jgi:putative membrane protein
MRLHGTLTTKLAAAPVALALTFAAYAQSPKTDSPEKQSQSSQVDRDSGARTQTSTSEEHSSRAETRSRTDSTAGTDIMVGPSDAKFLREAAEGGMMEVRLAQLAQQKAASDQVKQFAKQLEQDHEQANTKLKSLASAKKVDLPTEMGAKHQKMVTRLEGLPGAAFDREYMKLMVDDHKKDVKKFKKHADRAMDSDVKAFASETTPALEKHLNTAEQLRAEVRGTGTKARSVDTPASTEHPELDSRPADQSPSPNRGPIPDESGRRTPLPEGNNPTPQP